MTKHRVVLQLNHIRYFLIHDGLVEQLREHTLKQDDYEEHHTMYKFHARCAEAAKQLTIELDAAYKAARKG